MTHKVTIWITSSALKIKSGVYNRKKNNIKQQNTLKSLVKRNKIQVKLI